MALATRLFRMRSTQRSSATKASLERAPRSVMSRSLASVMLLLHARSTISSALIVRGEGRVSSSSRRIASTRSC